MSKLSNGFIVAAIAALVGSPLSAIGEGINNPGVSGLSGDCTATLGSPTIACDQLPHPGYVVNRWYSPIMSTFGAAGVAPGSHVIVCSFGGWAKKVTVGAVTLRVSTLFVGGDVQVAIYADDPATSSPGLFISSNTSSISTSLLGGLSAPLVPAVQIGPGSSAGENLWFCANMDNPTSAIDSFNPGTTSFGQMIGSTNLNQVTASNANVTGIYCAAANCAGGSSAFGSWPATLVGSTWTMTSVSSPILPGLQIQSVP